jgi:hypothetical protein
METSKRLKTSKDPLSAELAAQLLEVSGSDAVRELRILVRSISSPPKFNGQRDEKGWFIKAA